MKFGDHEAVVPNWDEINKTIRNKLLFFTVVMFGFGYALIPMYEKFCEVTGINSQRIPIEFNSDFKTNISRVIAIELDANARGLNGKFRPLRSLVHIHPGELAEVIYEIKNESDYEIIGQAVPSYSPRNLDQYLRKIECFCFTQQTLRPGEVKQMPVKFFINPELPESIDTVTISYTFFVQESNS